VTNSRFKIQDSKKIQKKQVQIIKIAQKQLGMSDDEYRLMLNERYWVNSCKDLTFEEASDLIDHFRKLGFRITGKKKAGKKYESSRRGLIREVEDLARERYGEGWEEPLNALCRRFGTYRYQWLDVAHAKEVKKRLRIMQEIGPYTGHAARKKNAGGV